MFDQINGLSFDPAEYSFAWSDCTNCNTPTRTELCPGYYTVTATHLLTGCQGQATAYVHLICTVSPNLISTLGNEVINTIDVYPTTFELAANVKFRLNGDARVTVDVYNLYGMPIKKLLDDELMTMGEHYLEYDASDDPDGVYIYVVNACQETKGDIGIKY